MKKLSERLIERMAHDAAEEAAANAGRTHWTATEQEIYCQTLDFLTGEMNVQRGIHREVRVAKCFQKYSSETRATMDASHRLGHVQKHAVGETFWTNNAHNVCYGTRKKATEAAHKFFIDRDSKQVAAGLTKAYLAATA